MRSDQDDKHMPLWKKIGLIVLFFGPLMSGVLGRALKGRPVYNGEEFETLLCAGARAAQGNTMYPPAKAFSCAQYDTVASYLYIPWPAQGLHGLVSMLGSSIITGIYAILFFAAIFAAIWIPIFRRVPYATVMERIPFAGMLTGSIILWGNIAGLVYGVIALIALVAHRAPLLFVTVIGVSGSLKQVWLCLLTVVLFLPRPWWQRLSLFSLGALIGLLPTYLFVSSGSSEVQAWMEILRFYALEDLPGQGFLGWLRFVGIDHDSLLNTWLWLPFAVLMVGSGLGIAEKFKLTPQQRVWLGLAVGSLLIPRVVSYEFFLFAPGMVLTMHCAKEVGKKWISWLVYGACALTLLFNIGDLGDYAILPLTFACALAIAITGVPYMVLGVSHLLPQRFVKQLEN